MARDEEDFATGPPGYAGDEPETGGSAGSRGCGIVGCLLVIVVLVGVAAGAMALTNVFEPLVDRYLWAPHDVVREYLDAYDRGDMDRAQRFLCSDTASARPPDPAGPMGGGGRGFGGELDEFPYPRADGRVAIYYQLDQHGPRAQALLEREDEGWRICAFE
jgi:hypothetical protein